MRVWQRYLPKACPVGGSKQAHAAAIIANGSQLNDVTYFRTCNVRKKIDKRMQLLIQTMCFCICYQVWPNLRPQAITHFENSTVNFFICSLNFRPLYFHPFSSEFSCLFISQSRSHSSPYSFPPLHHVKTD